MSFEERNAAWAGQRREFRQAHTRASAPRVWTIEIVGNQIHTMWGQLGGSMQQATEHMQGVNLGKKNAKTPEQYALERARETCRKQWRSGYREFVNGAQVDDVIEKKINFENPPESLCFYKPDNSMGASIEKKAREGKVWYSRKRNGLAFIIMRGADGPAKLYSRRMLRQHDDETDTELTWDDRFAGIRDAATMLMPPNSILLGELVVDRDGADDMAHVQSLTKSKTEQSWADQHKGRASFYIWDVAFWDGVDLVSTAPVRERYELIHEWDFSKIANILIPVEFYDGQFFKSPEEATEYAKKKGWEGWVVVDPDGTYDDKAYNFKGKPDRPGSVCAKLKPTYEDDFIAIWNPEMKIREMLPDAIIYESAKNATVGERSTKGRSNQGIKAVALFQYNKDGRLTYISNVSSGLTDDAKRDWANASLYPQVWKVEYKGRRYMSQGDDTNALDFAAFIECRSDKKAEECVNNEL
jgi:predicted DNA-binding WGR domain protein